jgi:hypothetical protein
MSERWVGFVVVGETVTVVDASIPNDDDEPVTVLADDTWRLQKGERAPAYAVLHQQCADYLRENGVERAVVKARALPTGAARLGLLTSAEVRGVIVAASASVCEVQMISKAVISRTYGERKVDEYLQDDGFWDEQTDGGKLRKTSREAAMLLVATRNA